MDSKCLESFLIPEEIATESGISDIIGPAILLAFIGLGGLYKQHKEENAKAKANKVAADKQKAEKEATKKALYEKYNLDDPKAKEAFEKSLMKDIDNKIKKMVNAANKNIKLFEELKKKVLELYDNDKSACNDILSELKPGYFKADYDNEGYYVIIEDQEVACICDLHCDIVEALECINSKDDRYYFASFSFGDGDEGCVYVDIKI